MNVAPVFICIPVVEGIAPRDAGIAVVSKAAVATGSIDCSKLGNMVGKYPTHTILGGLHIGTYQGLERARQYFSIVCFGQ